MTFAFVTSLGFFSSAAWFVIGTGSGLNNVRVFGAGRFLEAKNVEKNLLYNGLLHHLHLVTQNL